MRRVFCFILVLIIGSSNLPSFGLVKTGGEYLYEFGFIEGKPGHNLATKLDEGSALKRQELAALIAELIGEKESVSSFSQPVDYADSHLISSWAIPFVSYAKYIGWMSGKQGNKFDPEGPVSGQEMASVLMNALGYTVDSLNKYSTVLSDAAALGINIKPGYLTRGQAFEAMWVAVSKVKVKGEEVTLGIRLEKLEDYGDKPTVTSLEAVSIKALNLKQIEIVFSKEVDRQTTVLTNNYVVSGHTVSQVTVLEDNKTVILTLGGEALQSTKSLVSVMNIKTRSLDEVLIMKSTEVIFSDDISPTIQDVKAIGNKQVVITLSEPVAGIQASDFRINNNSLSLYEGLTFAISDGTGTQPVNQQYTIRFADELPVGLHQLSFEPVIARRDYAGLVLDKVTESIEVIKVSGSPTAVISSAIAGDSSSVVEVKFDRPIDIASTVLTNFHLNSFGNTPRSIMLSADQTVLVMTFGTMFVGDHVLEVSRFVEDAWGNSMGLENPRISFSAQERSEIRVVQSAVSFSDTKLRLIFNEPVELLSSQRSISYSVVDAFGRKVAPITSRSIHPIRGGSGSYLNRQVDITFDSWLPGGAYSIIASGIKNIDGYTLPSQAFTFFVNDNRAPTFETVSNTTHSAVYDPKSERVEIFFNEPMSVTGEYSIIDRTNWKINGTSLPAHVVLYPGAFNSSVIFQFSATDNFTPSMSIFTVIGVKDVAGNLMAGYLTGVTTVENVAGKNNPYVIADTVQAKSDMLNSDILTFEVSQDLIGFESSEFRVNGYIPTSGLKTGRELRLYLPIGAIGDGRNVELTLEKPKLTRNVDGAPIILEKSVASITANDKVPPTFVSAAVTAINQVTLTFNEPLNVASGSTFFSDYTINNNGTTVVPALSFVSGNNLVLQLPIGQTFVAGGTVRVYPSSVSNTQDEAGNIFVVTAEQKNIGFEVGNLASLPISPTLIAAKITGFINIVE